MFLCSPIDSRNDAPYVVVHLQPLQLSIAGTHRTLPCSTFTVHLQVGLKVKALNNVKKKEERVESKEEEEGKEE